MLSLKQIKKKIGRWESDFKDRGMKFPKNWVKGGKIFYKTNVRTKRGGNKNFRGMHFFHFHFLTTSIIVIDTAFMI